MPKLFARRLTALLGLAAAAAFLPWLKSISVSPAAHAAAAPPVEAAATGQPLAGSVQLVVFESEGCVYCNLFRRHVLPAYSASPRSREVPLRFLDLNAPDADDVALDAPVDLLPTAVLLLNNREVGRIPGYVAPESFFHAVNHLMSRLE
ncbi:MAG: hypothetical protein JNM89_00785 [Hyphomicrobiaceae bacterium]|nr:hypothetical protein [Hyphomicrobiaceae bacterium]